MLKLEKIYAGFYGYGDYSIQRKYGDNWYVCDKNNKLVSIKWTLKGCVEFIDNL